MDSLGSFRLDRQRCGDGQMLVSLWCFKKISMPKLEDQKKPDFRRVITSPTKVLIQELSDGLRLKIASLDCARFQQQPRQLISQFVSHPVQERQSKALF